MSGTQADTPFRWYKAHSAKDVATAVALLLFATGGFVFINPTGASVYPGGGGITWRTMPFVYAGLLFLLGSIYLVQSLRGLRAELATGTVPPSPDGENSGTVVLRRVVSLILLLIYASLLQVVGFAIMTPLFLLALFRLFQRGAWAGDLGLAAVGGLAMWVLFVPVLKMNLAGRAFDPLTPLLLQVFEAVVG